ncbi:MAG: amino acid ABC transporter permease [Planctomycetota bacterium]
MSKRQDNQPRNRQTATAAADPRSRRLAAIGGAIVLLLILLVIAWAVGDLREIIQHVVNWMVNTWKETIAQLRIEWPRLKRLGEGFLVTLQAAGLSLVIGFAASIPAGAILHRGPHPAGHQGLLHALNWLLYATVRSFVDFIRGTPALVQLLFVHYGLPHLLGVNLAPMTSAVLTLSVNSMAYMAEVVRSGLMSVDPGQKLAGRALGLSKLQVFRLIVWPQAFRIAIPPLMNSVVALTKDTALISIITVPEVVFQAKKIIASTYQPIKYYLIVAVMFFVVTFPLMKLAGYLERRIREKGFAE